MIQNNKSTKLTKKIVENISTGNVKIHPFELAEEEYNKYFDWKDTHFVERRIQPIFACDICSKLNQPDQVKPVKLSDWWNQRKCLGSWKDLGIN